MGSRVRVICPATVSGDKGGRGGGGGITKGGGLGFCFNLEQKVL